MSGTGDSLNNAIELGKRAVSLDQEGKFKEAASYYEQAAQSLNNLAAVCSDLPQSLVLKAVEYKQRAVTLLKSGKYITHLDYKFSFKTFILNFLASSQNSLLSAMDIEIVNRARHSITMALEADENGEKTLALEKYIQAVEFCKTQVSKSTHRISSLTVFFKIDFYFLNLH